MNIVSSSIRNGNIIYKLNNIKRTINKISSFAVKKKKLKGLKDVIHFRELAQGRKVVEMVDTTLLKMGNHTDLQRAFKLKQF